MNTDHERGNRLIRRLCVKKEFHYAFIVSNRVNEIDKRHETNRTFSKIDLKLIDNRSI